MKLMTPFKSLPLLFMMATGGGTLAADESSKSQTILRAGSQPSVKNPADYFTGSVYYDPLFPSSDSTPVQKASPSTGAIGPQATIGRPETDRDVRVG